MEEPSLSIPASILESLPADGETAAADMERAVEGWERRLGRVVAERDPEEAAGVLLDAVERFDERRRRYDEFVPELRAWGQSPVYAVAWRNLYASLIEQLYEQEGLGERLDRERNARLVEDGIRLRDLEE